MSAQELFRFVQLQPEKTAAIWRRCHWFPRQMTSEKRALKFHTDDATLPRSGQCFWLNQVSHVARPIRNTNQIWVVTRHQCGISALVSQTSFRWETGGGVAKCRPFSQATPVVTQSVLPEKNNYSQARNCLSAFNLFSNEGFIRCGRRFFAIFVPKQV